MSLECSLCERDLRDGHAEDCPRAVQIDEVLCPFDGMIVCRHGCTRPDQRACVDGP